MVLGDLQGLVDPLLDGHGGHHDDELGEPVPAVQLEDRSQVDVGFARTGLHLYAEVPGGQGLGGPETVLELDVIQVGVDLVIQELEAIPHTQSRIQALQGLHAKPGFLGYGELGAANLLALEEGADGLDGGVLVVQVGFEMELHAYKLRTLSRPCWLRMAVRLVLVTSSAKALSRKTMVVSPAGASSLCQAAMPRARGS